jgi:hypothetical protein
MPVYDVRVCAKPPDGWHRAEQISVSAFSQREVLAKKLAKVGVDMPTGQLEWWSRSEAVVCDKNGRPIVRLQMRRPNPIHIHSKTVWSGVGTAVGVGLLGYLIIRKPAAAPTNDPSMPNAAPATPTSPSNPSGSTGPLVITWQLVQDGESTLTVDAGHRYAALVSVSKNFSLDQITKKLSSSYGFTTTYAWEYGTPTRNKFAIDDWLASLPADTRDNHRWVWIEGNASQAMSEGRDAPWPFTVYHIASLYEYIPSVA